MKAVLVRWGGRRPYWSGEEGEGSTGQVGREKAVLVR